VHGALEAQVVTEWQQSVELAVVLLWQVHWRVDVWKSKCRRMGEEPVRQAAREPGRDPGVRQAAGGLARRRQSGERRQCTVGPSWPHAQGRIDYLTNVGLDSNLAHESSAMESAHLVQCGIVTDHLPWSLVSHVCQVSVWAWNFIFRLWKREEAGGICPSTIFSTPVFYTDAANLSAASQINLE